MSNAFTTEIRGGGWTTANRGKAFDCIVAKAKPGLATSFCARYQLNKMASFSFSLYGEAIAGAMALEWCRRMQWFFDIACSAGEGYVFTPSDKAAYTPSKEWLAVYEDLPMQGRAWDRAQALCSLFPVLKP